MKLFVRAIHALAIVSTALSKVSTGSKTRQSKLTDPIVEDSLDLLQEDNFALRHTLALVLEKNADMERRLEQIAHQTSECMSRLSHIERDSAVEARRLKKKGKANGPTKDFNSVSSQNATDIAEQQSLVLAAATSRLESLEKSFGDFRKKIRSRVKKNSVGVSGLKKDVTKASSTVGKLTNRFVSIKEGFNQASKELQLLNGVVDAHTLKIQQIAKEGPFKSTSDEETSNAEMESMKLELDSVGAKLQTLSLLVDGHTKAIAAQQAAITGMVIDSVGQTDPILAAVMSSFATDLNATKAQVDDMEGRVTDCEDRLDSMFDSLASSNETSNSTTSYDAQIAILVSATERNSMKITELETAVFEKNSSDVTELELAVAELSDTINGTSQGLEDLYVLVETYVLTAANATNGSSVTPMGNVSVTPSSTELDSLKETVQDIYAQLSVIENAMLNGSSTGSNSTDESTVSLLQTLVSLMRGELDALTLTVRAQTKHLNDTDVKVDGLTSALAQAVDISETSNGTNSSSSLSMMLALKNSTARIEALEEAVFTNGSENRIDELELAVSDLQADTNVPGQLPTLPNVTYSLNMTFNISDLIVLVEALTDRVTDIDNALFTNASASRVEILEEALAEIQTTVAYIEVAFNTSSPTATNSSNATALCNSQSVCSELSILRTVFEENSARLDDLELASSVDQNLTTRVTKVETKLQRFIDQLRNASSDSLSIPDAQLAALLSTVEENTAKIQELEVEYSTMSLTFSGLAAALNASSASMDNTADRIKELTTAVGNHDSELGALSAGLGDLATTVQAASKKADAVELDLGSFVNSTGAALSDLKAKLSTPSSAGPCSNCNGTGPVGDLEEVLQTLNATAASLSSLEAAVADQSKKITSNSATVDDLASVVAAHSSRLGEIEDELLPLATVTERVNATQAQIKNLKSSVSTELTSIHQDIDLVAKMIDDNAQGLAAVVDKVNATSAALQTLSDSIGSLGKAPDLSKFACISDDSTDKDIIFKGCNVHIINGEDYTESTNSYGNLIIGYNDATSSCLNNCTRTGSHNIVLGTDNAYSSYGGIVTGEQNSILGKYATITGGTSNEASGMYASISGGEENKADGFATSISGGRNNLATGYASSVVGARGLTADSAYDTMPWDLTPAELQALGATYLDNP